MFVFTYLPQAAVMAFTSGPLAAISAALLVLSESSTLTMVLSKALIIEESLIDTFDGTLVERGQPELVAKDRQVKGGGAGDVIARLGKLASRPFAKFTPTAIIRYFMYLPLNLIPVRYDLSGAYDDRMSNSLKGRRNRCVRRSAGQEVWTAGARALLSAQEHERPSERKAYRC